MATFADHQGLSLAHRHQVYPRRPFRPSRLIEIGKFADVVDLQPARTHPGRRILEQKRRSGSEASMYICLVYQIRTGDGLTVPMGWCAAAVGAMAKERAGGHLTPVSGAMNGPQFWLCGSSARSGGVRGEGGRGSDVG